MSMQQEIILKRHELPDGLYWAEIILNRPDKGNAINMSMVSRLCEIADELKDERQTRVVVIRATGRFFCTGGDIEAWGGMTPHDMGRDWILKGIDAFERISSLPQPVIAAINGHTLGGGLELALAADLRISVKQAKFGSPEATLAMIPGWMGTRKLAETIGPARARHMVLLASPITAEEALNWGLITALAEDESDLNTKLDIWLKRLVANGPSAMALIKGILSTMHLDMRAHHSAVVAQAAATEDCKEGVRAFIEKRKPVYKNC